MEEAGSPVMQTPGDAFNYISPIGYHNSAECGYCRGRRASPNQKRFSYYARATELNPGFYQTLLDRCWRRSGTLLYRPNQQSACCPHYTLRLDSAAFKPTKDQRQTINRFTKYILGHEYIRDAARLHPRSRAEAKRRNTVFDLVERVHEPESEFLPASPPEPAHKFTVTLERDDFTEEKYAVYANYQAVVHQEPATKINRRAFTRFLCNSPVRRSTAPPSEPGGRERLLGSYHQCYRLDGVLVAVGVLDLLPECVSAVYFMYHESIHSHNPGKLGALREIALAIEGGYRWWYSGYYIHSCPKMRYKMDYMPQNILNPATLTWHQLDKGDNLSIFNAKGLAKFPKQKTSPPAKLEIAVVAEKKGGDGHGVASSDGSGDSKNANGTQENGVAKAADGADKKDEDVVKGEEEEQDDIDDNDDDDDEADSGMDSEEFLLRSNMPGMMSLDEVTELNLGNIRIAIDSVTAGYFRTSDLMAWQGPGVSAYPSFKSRVAELAAVLGGDLIDDLCLDFRHHPSAD